MDKKSLNRRNPITNNGIYEKQKKLSLIKIFALVSYISIGWSQAPKVMAWPPDPQKNRPGIPQIPPQLSRNKNTGMNKYNPPGNGIKNQVNGRQIPPHYPLLNPRTRQPITPGKNKESRVKVEYNKKSIPMTPVERKDITDFIRSNMPKQLNSANKSTNKKAPEIIKVTQTTTKKTLPVYKVAKPVDKDPEITLTEIGHGGQGTIYRCTIGGESFIIKKPITQAYANALVNKDYINDIWDTTASNKIKASIKILEKEKLTTDALMKELDGYITNTKDLNELIKVQGADGIVPTIGNMTDLAASIKNKKLKITETDKHALVQPIVDGYDLDKACKKNLQPYNTVINSSEAIRLSIGFISILRSIHTAGYVHSDLKPENIMLQKNSKTVRDNTEIPKDLNYKPKKNYDPNINYDPRIIDLGGLVKIDNKVIVYSLNAAPEIFDNYVDRIIELIGLEKEAISERVPQIDIIIECFNTKIREYLARAQKLAKDNQNELIEGLINETLNICNETNVNLIREEIKSFNEIYNRELESIRKKENLVYSEETEKYLTETEKYLTEIEKYFKLIDAKAKKKRIYLKNKEMAKNDIDIFEKFEKSICHCKAQLSQDIYTAGTCLLSFWFGKAGNSLADSLFNNGSIKYLNDACPEITAETFDKCLNLRICKYNRIEYFHKKLESINNGIYDKDRLNKMSALLAKMLAPLPWDRPTIEDVFDDLYEIWVLAPKTTRKDTI
ncbi:MAG: hypothetical protein LBI37_00120 [Puniceicoccales bacterium]|nr:hypothetical protein [Puniceicoccales bacterium]